MNKCKLGNFVFAIAPERELDKSMGREIAKLDVPGGVPKYQDMGTGEKTLSFSGVFDGKNAYSDALKVEKLMNQGQWLPFRFGKIAETVRIKAFSIKIIRLERVRYSLELIVKSTSPTIEKQEDSKKASIAVSKSQAIATIRTYVIKQGDTLWELAERYYGKGHLWEKIAKANKIVSPRKLRIGQKIVIPK